MALLADEQVTAGRKDLSAVSAVESEELIKSLPDWAIVKEDDVDKLKREYRFNDYLTLLALTKKIGNIAEQVNHHPVIITEWGKVTVLWWTHTIAGLHRNDFIMAARCDRAAMLVSAP
ncbi:MAG: 4a-hydroxytetrahydrobiopterin dehydratase [Gammaproteobacteria bacterium]|jgi:4a-hydroxytetrahydrobiopterin dehydratase|nr:4a-hydroxytetrahydrobiopterin dehydratase [Gammaproteobacteria bacterium]MBT6042492.1 4a-hydroxytetrahydrobiopterin dehydratase [Gammaproteobacteria bacterium]